MRVEKTLLYAGLLFFVSCQDKKISSSESLVNQPDFSQQRKKMVLEQVIQRKIKDPKVIKALEKVPRHLFIPKESWSQAYEDKPVSIGFQQTISQPYIVALMTEVLSLKPGEKVLEIGTGSGYQAALLAELGAETYSIEIIPELAKFAKKNLKQTGYEKIQVKTGDGYLGWKEFAPFDAIIVTCAPEDVPPSLLEQLKEEGRMVIPIGLSGEVQELLLLKKSYGRLHKESLAPVRFVPMVGENPRKK
ncbi:MAG: protein-L-isoaspartate O-methyltransferase [Elusimicrobia bacterium RIFCSPLOWO2_02_FULL_39_32]|nr:MAG: protein-L-isoaspartate O-methyltransferase [Elusimicrobia bacterium GWA2_38_7]OGR79419.1 MAG: protein-L-isoaspartate O-methyltransferase [Elusimicrobia bacterium RIFCSPHIGHO2_02_FULL_39_36]OGR92746.1 MAG: protein-L-isoaspartate O-methyltransferase [Elusimicrobia bacterium RIFCSPLOWO2_02_FULL_39_32]OGR99531.1 MAG: protein-L-isoaspartate O-methyltransferase [Elusimicrobia bacterium RIFCSPLOWO2_12_FULL_39_28]